MVSKMSNESQCAAANEINCRLVSAASELTCKVPRRWRHKSIGQKCRFRELLGAWMASRPGLAGPVRMIREICCSQCVVDAGFLPCSEESTPWYG